MLVMAFSRPIWPRSIDASTWDLISERGTRRSPTAKSPEYLNATREGKKALRQAWCEGEWEAVEVKNA